MAYPVYLHLDDRGSASGFFPGVLGCYFAGNSFDDALIDAAQALEAHFELLLELGMAIPEPTTIQQHQNDGDCIDGIWGSVDLDLSR